MRNTLYLAGRYLAFHRMRTALLVVSLTLILYLPIALQLLASITEEQLMTRAKSTPLVLGARGSSLDLVIDSLYFDAKELRPIHWSDYEAMQAEGLGEIVPLSTRFRAHNAVIVGTTLAYFKVRDLSIAAGKPLLQLGDCVLGAKAAQTLKLAPGDSLLSTPENLFDIAGAYPLKMKVVGVLAPAHSPDDNAVFVDIKTAWVIEGLGHGHQDLDKVEDPDVILKKQGNEIAANAKLMTYTEITPENLTAFHFHGDRGDFPISAALCFPDSRKSEDLLRGRYQENERLQIVKPEGIIESLNTTLFRIRRIMNSGIAVVAMATALLVVLVFMLSIQLRQSEIQTLHKLGCARGTIGGLLCAELVIIGGLALFGAGALAMLTSAEAERLIQAMIL